MVRHYYRPLVQVDIARPDEAVTLAGGWGWFTHAEVLTRDAAPRIVAAANLPADVRTRLEAPRARLAGVTFERPRIMGILNTTPDSFSDGGRHAALSDAVVAGQAMIQNGADIIDVGGESTRPGAQPVAIKEEIRRTAPVIAALRAAGAGIAVSIDTRNAQVAKAALDAGADLINDVSGFTHDPALAPLAAASGKPVCVMHAQGDPQTMQQDPQYADVLLDVYDFLEARIAALANVGIATDQILADPGIGFGKTLSHNLALLARISLFHSLGVPILLGASRKRFIGTLGGASEPQDRAPGSMAVALAALAQGVQMVRVHDIEQTRQAVSLWHASVAGHGYD